MTPPAQGAGGTCLTVRFDPVMDGWSFSGTPAGPAGTWSLMLDEDVRLTVDAAEPDVIVEVAVAAGPDGEATPAVVNLVRALLGAGAARQLEGRRLDEPVAVELTGDPAILSSASALAVAHATARRPLAHRLRSLDVALHAVRVGHPIPEADAARAAWEAFPATVALARACETYPEMLASVPVAAMGELRARLMVLLHLVERADPSIVRSAAYQLVAGLTERIAGDRPDALAGVDVPTALAALEFDDEFDDHPVLDIPIGSGPGPLYKSDGPAAPEPRTLSWTGSVADYTFRLGSEAALLHLGAFRADGQAPGVLTVRVPVALGVRTQDLVNVLVRAVTEDGHLLAEGPLAVERDVHRLPEGVVRLELPDLAANGLPYDRIEIDIASHLRSAPTAADLVGLDRFRAAREGQEAVACDAAGHHAVSAVRWRRCAAQLGRLGELDLQDLALDYAERAEARSAGPDRPEPEWLTALLTGWSEWTHAEINRIGVQSGTDAAEPAIAALRGLVDRLAGWNDPSIELARARRELGRALRAAPQHLAGPGEAERGEAEPDEAEHQLREAMRIFYDLDETGEALACLRELGSRTLG